MKESKFIEQNKENWLEFEKNLRYKKNKVSRLNRLFIQITDDLSYVRTFYKNRSVKVYLNGIAQILFNDIYRNKPASFKTFVNFWKYDLPEQVYCARKEFLISFSVFTLAFVIGILSSIYDKDFARLILGDEYVKMTLENIKNNDPLAVYKKAHETGMFVSITVNNLVVASYTFIFGMLFSVGTVLSLIKNGVMVGCFQYFFIEKGLFKQSFLTIWQHGTLEISAIIIAGAAGIALGKGLVFPGTYSRVDAFKISAMRGLKIFTGIAPVIILAAFIEGFITRHTEVNDFVRLSVILVSLSFIIFYFVWYPRYLFNKKIIKDKQRENISFKSFNEFDFSKILSAEEIFGYVIRFVKQNIFHILLITSSIAIFHAIGSVVYQISDNETEYSLKHTYLSFFDFNVNTLQYFIGILTLTVLQITIITRLNKTMTKSSKVKTRVAGFSKILFSTLLSSILIISPFYFGLFWGILSFFLLSPYLFLAVYCCYVENIHFFTALYKLYEFLDNSWGKLYWNSLKNTLLVGILYIMLHSYIVWQYVEAIYLNLSYSYTVMHLVEMFILTFSTIALFSIYCYMQIVSSAMGYYAFNETMYAKGLKERIKIFGERNSMFGFDKE